MDIHGWQEYLYTQGFVSMDERVKTAILNGEVDVLSLKALEPTEYEEYIYES
jgi:hypothetical protein